MQKDYLNFLISESKKFAKQEGIFDIAVFGSFAKGKSDYRDIDLLLIFKDRPLRERARIAADFKEIISKIIKNADIKTINLDELFDKSFLAMQSIFIDGYSLVHEAAFSESMGFEGFSIFSYKLNNLSNVQKTRFIYALSGRKNIGLSSKLGVISIGRGAVLVPARNSLMFEDFLRKWKISFNKKDALISKI